MPKAWRDFCIGGCCWCWWLCTEVWKSEPLFIFLYGLCVPYAFAVLAWCRAISTSAAFPVLWDGVSSHSISFMDLRLALWPASLDVCPLLSCALPPEDTTLQSWRMSTVLTFLKMSSVRTQCLDRYWVNSLYNWDSPDDTRCQNHIQTAWYIYMRYSCEFHIELFKKGVSFVVFNTVLRRLIKGHDQQDLLFHKAGLAFTAEILMLKDTNY